jgi:polyisoprenoid-binding protein YceI
VVSAATVAACGGAGVPAALATPEPTRSASPSPSPSAAPTVAPSPATGSLTFTVASGSKAIVRVTEQLADRQDISDAVLTSEKVTGEFTLQPDGTFAPSSKITVDLTALSSDSRQRDDFIKQDTLRTRQFPTAVFVPTKTEGLTLPLAASGDLSFKLTGKMTIRDVTKDLIFDVKAKRDGSSLTATATVTPAFQFGTFGMTQPRVFSVLSIKDEIRLEVQLVATQKP